MKEKRKKGNVAFDTTSRRQFVATLGAGLVISGVGAGMGRAGQDEYLLRPPGAIEDNAFISLCIRCGKCVPVCPNSAVRLQGLENGIENFMTPRLTFHEGYCITALNGCQNCIEACPPRVLQKFELEGVPSNQLSGAVKMGTAYVNESTCIPYADKEPCLACIEVCPVEGAITTKGRQLLKPVFNQDVCIGCGACEYACPTSPKSVLVKNTLERRNSWK